MQLEGHFTGFAREPSQVTVLAAKAFLWGLPLVTMIIAVRVLLRRP